jgi:hypothetical protein
MAEATTLLIRVLQDGLIHASVCLVKTLNSKKGFIAQAHRQFLAEADYCHAAFFGRS